MSVFLLTHILNLLFKLPHLIMSLIHDIVGIAIFRSVDILLIIVHVVDIGKFNLVVLTIVVVSMVITSEAAWFNKQHDWDQNDNNDKECKSNLHLRVKVVTQESSVVWGLTVTEVEDGINHEVNN